MSKSLPLTRTWRRPAQILGLTLWILGWGSVGCTLAMDHWRVAQAGGRAGSSVVATTWYWSNLWKDCYEDSTAVVNCVDLGVLWVVKPYVQAVRGLLLSGLCLGWMGTVLAFLGMECTRIGGDQRSKDGMLKTAAAFHLLGCLSDVAAYCLYINRVVAVFLHTQADPSELRYEIGTPLYLGLMGSFLVLLGCCVHCATVRRGNNPRSKRPTDSLIREKEASTGKNPPMNNESRGECVYDVTSAVMV